jgi:hypothetical protein
MQHIFSFFSLKRDINHRFIARMPVERYASEYNMQHLKRGYAIIFNHENFEIPSLKSRK